MSFKGRRKEQNTGDLSVSLPVFSSKTFFFFSRTPWPLLLGNRLLKQTGVNWRLPHHWDKILVDLWSGWFFFFKKFIYRWTVQDCNISTWKFKRKEIFSSQPYAAIKQFVPLLRGLLQDLLLDWGMTPKKVIFCAEYSMTNELLLIYSTPYPVPAT